MEPVCFTLRSSCWAIHSHAEGATVIPPLHVPVVFRIRIREALWEPMTCLLDRNWRVGMESFDKGGAALAVRGILWTALAVHRQPACRPADRFFAGLSIKLKTL